MNSPYMAGYVDGDGCIYLGKFVQMPKNIFVFEHSVQIVSVFLSTLQTMEAEWGGNIQKKPEKPRHKCAWCWTIKGKSAGNFLQEIFPYLVEKKEESSLFIEFQKTIFPNKGKKVSDLLIEERLNIIQKIRHIKEFMNLIEENNFEHLKNIKKSIDPKEEDFAYLAGLIDSEGCFRVKHWKPKNRPNEVFAICLEIGNTKLPVFPWLLQRFGGSVVLHKPKRSKRNVCLWNLSAKALFEILPKIYPHLRSKKEPCRKLMEFQETILPNGGDRHSEQFHRLYESIFSRRKRIIQEVHDLNRKGTE